MALLPRVLRTGAGFLLACVLLLLFPTIALAEDSGEPQNTAVEVELYWPQRAYAGITPGFITDAQIEVYADNGEQIDPVVQPFDFGRGAGCRVWCAKWLLEPGIYEWVGYSGSSEERSQVGRGHFVAEATSDGQALQFMIDRFYINISNGTEWDNDIETVGADFEVVDYLGYEIEPYQTTYYDAGDPAFGAISCHYLAIVRSYPDDDLFLALPIDEYAGESYRFTVTSKNSDFGSDSGYIYFDKSKYFTGKGIAVDSQYLGYADASMLKATAHLWPPSRLTITVPHGAELLLGENRRHYRVNKTYEPMSVDTTSLDGYDIYTYDVPRFNGGFVYNVGGGEFVKEESYFLVNEDTFSITVDHLEPLDNHLEFDPIPWWNNNWCEANVLLNTDDSRSVSLQTGEVFDLFPLRAWQVLTSDVMNDFFEPDYHFEVIDATSGESWFFDSFYDDKKETGPISIEEFGGMGGLRYHVKGNDPGLAIIKITYDAIIKREQMTVESMNGNVFEHTDFERFYHNPIEPKNTAVIPVFVGGADNSGINLHASILDGGNPGGLQGDTLYYLDTQPYADYTFYPTSTLGSVSVRAHEPVWDRPWDDSSSSEYGAGGWTEYEPNDDGSFTVHVSEGNNIIEVASGGAVKYQVVFAEKLSPVITNMGKPDWSYGDPVEVGDEIKIRMDGLNLPVPKLAAIYNPNYISLSYEVTPATTDFSNVRDYWVPHTVYGASIGMGVSITVTESGETTLSNGHIIEGWFGSRYGAHRNISLEGLAPNLNADSVLSIPYFSQLPNYTFSTLATPDEESKKQVAAAKQAIEDAASWSVASSKANTQEAVESWVDGEIAKLGLPDSVEAAVSISDFTAAINGTAQDKAGVAGSFVFQIALSAGEGDASATDTTSDITGTIRAKAYVDQAEAKAITDEALASVMAASLAWKANNFEEVATVDMASAWVKAMVEALLPDGVEFSEIVVRQGVSAPIDGTKEKPAGTDGRISNIKITLKMDYNDGTYTTTLNDGTIGPLGVIPIAPTPWKPAKDDASVDRITVAGFLATAGEEGAFSVVVPQGLVITADVISVTPTNPKATASSATYDDNLGAWSFTVTAEDGLTTASYTLAVSEDDGSDVEATVMYGAESDNAKWVGLVVNDGIVLKDKDGVEQVGVIDNVSNKVSTTYPAVRKVVYTLTPGTYRFETVSALTYEGNTCVAPYAKAEGSIVVVPGVSTQTFHLVRSAFTMDLGSSALGAETFSLTDFAGNAFLPWSTEETSDGGIATARYLAVHQHTVERAYDYTATPKDETLAATSGIWRPDTAAPNDRTPRTVNTTFAVTFAPRPPDAPNKENAEAVAKAVADFKAVAPRYWTADYQQATTSSVVRAWLTSEIANKLDLGGVTVTVTIDYFRAAEGGTVQLPGGREGLFTFSVTFAKGEGETRAEESLSGMYGPIAPPVDPIQDNADIAAAKLAVEGAVYATTQGVASSEAAVLSKIEETIKSLCAGTGVTFTVRKISYTVPVPGTKAAPTGVDGSYVFTATLTKGAGTAQTTGELTLTIAAQPYEENTGPLDQATASIITEAALADVMAASLAWRASDFEEVATVDLAKAWVKAKVDALLPDGVELASIVIQIVTAPTDGTKENPAGTDGRISNIKIALKMDYEGGTYTTVQGVGIIGPSGVIPIAARAYLPAIDDAAIDSLTVAGFPAVSGDNGAFSVVVPSDTALDATSFVVRTSNPHATVGEAVFDAEAACWRFSVTAADGTTVRSYTVTVTEDDGTPVQVIVTYAGENANSAHLGFVIGDGIVLTNSAQATQTGTPSQASGGYGSTAPVKRTTYSLVPGTYHFEATVSSAYDGNTYTDSAVAKGAIVVLPGVSTQTFYLVRSAFTMDAGSSTLGAETFSLTDFAGNAFLPWSTEEASGGGIATARYLAVYQNTLERAYDYAATPKDEAFAATSGIWRPDTLVMSNTIPRTINATHTVTFEAVPRVLTDIAVTQQPTKTAYLLDDELDLDGLEITASYADGSTEVLQEGDYLTDLASGSVLAQAGDVTITVTYTENGVEKTTTFVIGVSDVKSTDASVSSVTVAYGSAQRATAEAGSEGNFSVTLPFGTTLPQASAIEVTPTDAKATVSTPTTEDSGVTWAFTVTAEDGVTEAHYTLSVAIAPAPPVDKTDLIDTIAYLDEMIAKGSYVEQDYTATSWTAFASALEAARTAAADEDITQPAVNSALEALYIAWDGLVFTPNVRITVSVESLTVDGGFVVEPTAVEVPRNSTAAQALLAVLQAKGVSCNYSGQPNTGTFYVDSIGNLTAKGQGEDSGWMYTIDNQFQSGAGSVKVNTGDVMRWQYTLDLGLDIGGPLDLTTVQFPIPSTLPDKDALLARVAAISAEGTQANFAVAWRGAMVVLKQLDASQTEIDTAFASLAKPFVATTGITELPQSAVAGTPLELSGSVQPDNATYRDIAWAVKDAGGTGAVISGATLTVATPGTVTLVATVPLGASSTEADLDLVVEFSVEVTPSAAQALAAAQAERIAAINALGAELTESDYTQASWAALLAAKAAAILAVEQATTVEAVVAVALPSLSDILVEKDDDPTDPFAAERAARISAINAVASGLVEGNYTSLSWATFQAARASAILAVQQATSAEAIEAVALPSLDLLVTRAQELADAKAARTVAIEAVRDALNSSEYTQASWAEFIERVQVALDAVSAANSLEAVSAVPDPSATGLVTRAQELADAKAARIAAIEAVGAGLEADHYTQTSWEAFLQAVAAAKAAVEAASSTEAVGQVALPTTSILVHKPASVNYEEALIALNDWIVANMTSPAVGYVGGEWAVIGLARGGQVDRDTDWAKTYLGALDVALATGELKYTTDYERVVLALSALGIDASSYKGHDLTAPFKNYASVATSSNNAKIFGLIALDAKPYTGERDAYIQGILAAQLESGAWSISNTTPNFDLTAMAIQALAPYCGSVAGVDVAVDKAFAWLDLQSIRSAEGAAQVVVALTSLGRDSTSYVNALLGYRDLSSGAFTFDGEINAMTTEQATYALVAYDRYIKQASPLYDMGDVDYVVLEREASAADRGALEEAVNAASGIDLDLYTELSRAALDKALKDAQVIFANPDSTQAEVDTVTLALQKAIDNLVEKSTGGTDDPPSDDPTNNDNGGTTNNDNSTTNNDNSTTNNTTNETTNNTTNNTTTNDSGSGSGSGSARPTTNYYYYDSSGAGTNTASTSDADTDTDTRVAEATGTGTTSRTPTRSTESQDTATAVPEAEVPQTATPGAAIAIDQDALLSGGVYISTRALIGIGFGLLACALALVLILRLTARRKDLTTRDYHDHQDYRD